MSPFVVVQIMCVLCSGLQNQIEMVAQVSEYISEIVPETCLGFLFGRKPGQTCLGRLGRGPEWLGAGGGVLAGALPNRRVGAAAVLWLAAEQAGSGSSEKGNQRFAIWHLQGKTIIVDSHKERFFGPTNGALGSNSKHRSGFKLRTTHKVGLPSLCVGAFVASSTQKQYSGDAVHIAIVRLLANHPQFHIKLMTADRKAGEQFGSVFPHLIAQDLPNLVAIKDEDFSDVDAVFCCLPHGTTQEIIKGLPRQLKIVDLSADFRLRDINEYAEWYGHSHRAPELQTRHLNYHQLFSTICAIVFLHDTMKRLCMVANPGCYPTSIQLPLVPLIKAKLIKLNNIIIDAKSGVSGAGRGAKEANLYTEIAEGIHAYGIKENFYVPEIEQGLSDAAESKVTISITPNLICMKRGMQSIMYVELASGVTVNDLYQHLKSTYEGEEFVKLLRRNSAPQTRHVVGSNYCFMNVFEDRNPLRAIIISVIDNLVKGTSGQAVQNLNLMMGLPENMGLQYQPLFP
ncbi:probable N-acetyl-gamma-glutamyl-phosphate reductase, chloroplastic [Phragmites australis]|uniref:probable N-acetyl-gamma-glutamyl-phosphate reductase, chloroplastic n=1 Tax=Phragmites australis TaxID=29695 RepID=UPI002D7A0AEE|nr:probable N-acetyl-gamma-glutamyl-phosphate reductase, chloroplastic [Phragmites australis]